MEIEDLQVRITEKKCPDEDRIYKECSTMTRPPEEELEQSNDSDSPTATVNNNDIATINHQPWDCRRRMKTDMTDKEKYIYEQLLRAKADLSKYRRRIKQQEVDIKRSYEVLTNSLFLKSIEKMPETAKTIILMQFREVQKKKQRVRFTKEEKVVAFSIMRQYPRAYRFLTKIFTLPSQSTLRRLCSKVQFDPAINKNDTLPKLKSMAKKLTIRQRLCLLLFEEKILKPVETPNQMKDDGLETLPMLADHALVFMIRGLLIKYNHGVSYTLSIGATKGTQLAALIKTIITELQEVGYKVLATVCDQTINNRRAIEILTNEAKCLYGNTGKPHNGNIFLVNNQEIVTLYDAPNLLKATRNKFLKNNLVFEQNGETKTAKWQHIEWLHQKSPQYNIHILLSKLTRSQVYPKKAKVKSVEQACRVFSRSVGSWMGLMATYKSLPREALDTAHAILFFDSLFDSVNGNRKEAKKDWKPLSRPVTPSSLHRRKWSEAKNILKSMKFVDCLGNVERVPTFDCWIWTLEGLEILIRKLRVTYLITSVWARDLNKEPLVQIFDSVGKDYT